MPDTTPRDAEFTQKQRWYFTTPKIGPPGSTPVKGTRQLMALLSPTCGDELELEIRRINGDRRNGRSNKIRVWRDDSEVHPTPSEAYDDDDDDGDGAESVIMPTTAGPLLESQAALAAAKSDLARIERQIAEATRELETIRSRRDVQLVAANRIVSDAMDHAEAQIRRAWRLDEDAGAFRVKSQEQLVRSFDAILATRTRADELLERDSWGDLLKTAKEIIGDALDSPIGQMVGLQLSAVFSAAAARMMGMDNAGGTPIQAKDAIRQMVVEGAKHRERCGAIITMTAIRPNNPVARGAALALQVADGSAELDALLHLLDQHETL